MHTLTKTYRTPTPDTLWVDRYPPAPGSSLRQVVPDPRHPAHEKVASVVADMGGWNSWCLVGGEIGTGRRRRRFLMSAKYNAVAT